MWVSDASSDRLGQCTGAHVLNKVKETVIVRVSRRLAVSSLFYQLGSQIFVENEVNYSLGNAIVRCGEAAVETPKTFTLIHTSSTLECRQRCITPARCNTYFSYLFIYLFIYLYGNGGTLHINNYN